MSIIDKVKDIFDGRPEVHHDASGYWVDVGGNKHHGASLDELETELRRALSERQAVTPPRDFEVTRIHTGMIATSDIAAGEAEAHAVGDFEAALAAVPEARDDEGKIVED
jgi:hypothetical protein